MNELRPPQSREGGQGRGGVPAAGRTMCRATIRRATWRTSGTRCPGSASAEVALLTVFNSSAQGLQHFLGLPEDSQCLLDVRLDVRGCHLKVNSWSSISGVKKDSQVISTQNITRELMKAHAWCRPQLVVDWIWAKRKIKGGATREMMPVGKWESLGSLILPYEASYYSHVPFVSSRFLHQAPGSCKKRNSLLRHQNFFCFTVRYRHIQTCSLNCIILENFGTVSPKSV